MSGIDSAFVRRTLFQFSVAAAIYVLWKLVDVLLLAFGAVLVAVLLHSIADPLRRKTPLNAPLALIAAGALIVAVLALAGWLFGSLISSQVSGLAKLLPHSLAELKDQVSRLPFGSQLAAELQDLSSVVPRLQGLAGRIGGYALTAAGALTNFFMVVFAGVFLAAQPDVARNGLLAPFPPGAREQMGDALDAGGQALRFWLLGTLADMLVAGALTTVGAMIVGLPSPLALGLLSALATFVPVVGPIAAAVPGLLVAAQFGMDTTIWTLVMYIVVQQIEGNLIFPFIQRRAVNLPPFLCLFGVLAFGALLGVMGLILATPLLIVIFTLIKVLYIRNVLGEDVQLPGERD